MVDFQIVLINNQLQSINFDHNQAETSIFCSNNLVSIRKLLGNVLIIFVLRSKKLIQNCKKMSIEKRILKKRH